MFKLLKNGICYSPKFLGKKDILVVQNKIYKIQESIDEKMLFDTEVIDCSNKIVCPGFIDQHVHIMGGGGEDGPQSRIPELMMGEIITSGVTTLVGVLGFDSITRNIAGLLAKARALEADGINTYIYTGSYGVPTATLMGKVMDDITLIDKVIGVGEIAISDHRSSHPTLEMLRDISYEARVGGLLSKKAGIVHVHVGDGRKGLEPLVQLVENSDFPLEMYVPTHLNRNRFVFDQAIEYAKKGGYIDFTAGQTADMGYTVPDAIKKVLDAGIQIDKVTVSSDANGSIPSDGNDPKVGKVSQLFNDIINTIVSKNLDIETVLKTVTLNVAKVLKLYPRKGALEEGSDADILILEKDSFKVLDVLINGEFFVQNSIAIKKGLYEV